MSSPFKKGDLLQVTVTKTDRTPGLLSTFVGTALDTRGISGWADFRLRVITDTQGHTADIDFNLNQVEAVRLFSADVARDEDSE